MDSFLQKVYKLFHTTEISDDEGFSLVELAIVMTIVGVIIGVIWVTVPMVQENNRQSRWAQEMLQIVEKTRQLYTGQASMGTMDITASLVAAGVFPGDMSPTVGPYNPWNGVVTVVGNTSTFYLTGAGMSQQGCVNSAMNNTVNATDAGLSSLTINGSTVSTFPMPLASAQADCSNVGNANTLRYEYTMR